MKNQYSRLLISIGLLRKSINCSNLVFDCTIFDRLDWIGLVSLVISIYRKALRYCLYLVIFTINLSVPFQMIQNMMLQWCT